MRVTNNNIQTLNDNEVFVFGSNESGKHGAGAAALAYKKFGAVWGKGFGLWGDTFAIPTKDLNIQTLSIDEIRIYVNMFQSIAKDCSDLTFLVTEIGCGLAGYTPKDIAPLFYRSINIENIHLPESFWNILRY